MMADRLVVNPHPVSVTVGARTAVKEAVSKLDVTDAEVIKWIDAGCVVIPYPAVGGKSAETRASLTTAMAGANNDIVLTAKEDVREGNDVSLTIVDPPGNNAALSVTVSGNAITVNGATDGVSALTSTASQVIAAINADAAASALVTASLAAANDGTGVVTALAQTYLAGGKTTFRNERRECARLIAYRNLRL